MYLQSNRGAGGAASCAGIARGGLFEMKSGSLKAESYNDPMPEKPADAQPVAPFETSLEELEKLVKELEAGDLSLERSIELFERGMTLSDACRKQLEDAETRVEMLVRRDGKMTAEPLQTGKS